jgi:riboflavin biosynthesis pyrimidine reductase
VRTEPDWRVQRLLPLPAVELPLRGLYLDPELERLRPSPSEDLPLVYANFVTSLDGRIAVGADEISSRVPAALTTRADWRLFQELQAHADCLITHGGYLRALADGRLGDILQVGGRGDAADLSLWRQARGVHGQPAVIIVSSSLAFPLPDTLLAHDRRVVVIAPSHADRARIDALRQQGVDVRQVADTPHVAARSLLAVAAELGCRRVYLQSGPVVFEDMLRSGLLGRLYLTISTQLVGGDAFHTLLNGPGIGAAGKLTLERIYHLAGNTEASAQLFTSYSVQTTEGR